MKKYREVTEELADLEGKLAEAEAIKEASKAQQAGAVEDDLDNFMRSLKSQAPDKHKRVTWKVSMFMHCLLSSIHVNVANKPLPFFLIFEYH